MLDPGRLRSGRVDPPPLPAGPIVQSEHFDIDPQTGRITRLRSYDDPRKLLGEPPA